jgi:hypothetical protein
MTTPAPDFRAELERLLELYEALGGNWTPHNYTDTWNDALASTRAALATPPPEPPTDDELNALWNCCGDHDEEGDHYGNIFQFARAVLDRWGK